MERAASELPTLPRRPDPGIGGRSTLGLPTARGRTTAALLAALREPPHHLPPIALPAGEDPLADEDLQLALYLCYELHYRGLPGVDERWEWSPSLLALRQALEARFESALRAAVGPVGPAPAPEELDLALRGIVDADDSPALSRHVERAATLEHGPRRDLVVPRLAVVLRIAGVPVQQVVEVEHRRDLGQRAQQHVGAPLRRVHARRQTLIEGLAPA